MYKSKKIKILLFLTYPFIFVYFLFSTHLMFAKNHNGESFFLDFLLNVVDENCSNITFKEINSKELLVFFANINEGNAKCIIKKLENKETLVIYNNLGGSMKESIILGNYIKNNNLKVIPLNYCASGCASVYFSSSYGLYCNYTSIMVHQSSHDENIMNHFSKILRQYEKSIILKNNHNFNYEYYDEVISKTPFEKIYLLSKEEMLKNGMMKQEINCEKYYQ